MVDSGGSVVVRSKKERKDQRKRDRKRRAVAKEKRQKMRTKNAGEKVLFVEPRVDEFAGGWFGDELDGESRVDRKENAEIQEWWEQYLNAAGNERVEMTRVAVSGGMDEEWREALFPEAVFEAESKCESSRYVELLEFLAEDHRDLYQTGFHWFLRSRVAYYLTIDDAERIDRVVAQDAGEMTETGEAFYGTVSMLRLADLEPAADALAAAGFRCMDEKELMPWAVDEIFHFALFKHVRECIRSDATDEAIRVMEHELRKLDANMDKEVVDIRREIVLCSAGQQAKDWQRDQLLGTSRKAIRNRYLLGYEFVGWLATQRSISFSAADELRGLVFNTLSRDKLQMQDYLDGVPQRKLDEHLASLLGFMAFDRFKAPATLIAIDHFANFLAERELIDSKSFQRTLSTAASLDQQLRRALNDEWHSFQFLDRLRPVAT